jgi:hypothetical protein
LRRISPLGEIADRVECVGEFNDRIEGIRGDDSDETAIVVEVSITTR